jgi:hypothetical protein
MHLRMDTPELGADAHEGPRPPSEIGEHVFAAGPRHHDAGAIIVAPDLVERWYRYPCRLRCPHRRGFALECRFATDPRHLEDTLRVELEDFGCATLAEEFQTIEHEPHNGTRSRRVAANPSQPRGATDGAWAAVPAVAERHVVEQIDDIWT